MNADPVPSGCTDVLRDDLGWALGVVFRAYAKAASAAFTDVPGGPRGYQVLAAAARSQPGSQQELAGLIERRPDPADRRARRIAATGRGAALLGDLDERLHAAEDGVLSGLD